MGVRTCVHACVRVCVHVCVCACVCASISYQVGTSTCKSIHYWTSDFRQWEVCVCVRVRACVCVCMLERACVCIRFLRSHSPAPLHMSCIQAQVEQGSGGGSRL